MTGDTLPLAILVRSEHIELQEKTTTTHPGEALRTTWGSSGRVLTVSSSQSSPLLAVRTTYTVRRNSGSSVVIFSPFCTKRGYAEMQTLTIKLKNFVLYSVITVSYCEQGPLC